MTVNGLPLHPLLVHVIVIGMPLTALALLLHAVWPVARRRLGIVTPLAAVVVLIFVPITQQAGEALEASLPGIDVREHQERGELLLPWAIAMLVVAIAVWLWHGPLLTDARGRLTGRAPTVITVVLAVLAVLVAVGSTYQVVITGDSGARAVWGG